MVPVIKSHNTNSIKPTTITAAQGLTHTPAISQKNQKPKTTVTHNEEKIALVLALAGGFAIWNVFRWKLNKMCTSFCEDLVWFPTILLYGSPAELV